MKIHSVIMWQLPEHRPNGAGRETGAAAEEVVAVGASSLSP